MGTIPKQSFLLETEFKRSKEKLKHSDKVALLNRSHGTPERAASPRGAASRDGRLLVGRGHVVAQLGAARAGGHHASRGVIGASLRGI